MKIIRVWCDNPNAHISLFTGYYNVREPRGLKEACPLGASKSQNEKLNSMKFAILTNFIRSQKGTLSRQKINLCFGVFFFSSVRFD